MSEQERIYIEEAKEFISICNRLGFVPESYYAHVEGRTIKMEMRGESYCFSSMYGEGGSFSGMYSSINLLLYDTILYASGAFNDFAVFFNGIQLTLDNYEQYC